MEPKQLSQELRQGKNPHMTRRRTDLLYLCGDSDINQIIFIKEN